MLKAHLSAGFVLALLGAAPALAADLPAHPGWHHHHHRHHAWHRHHWHRHFGLSNSYRPGPYVIGYGETIISGRTGLHLDHLSNTMVPDSAGPDLILSGRKRGSGLGANGLPGSNTED